MKYVHTYLTMLHGLCPVCLQLAEGAVYGRGWPVQQGQLASWGRQRVSVVTCLASFLDLHIYNLHNILKKLSEMTFGKVRLWGTRLSGIFTYKELIFIPQSLPRNFIYCRFIRNCGYKELIFIVSMSSL